MLKLLVILFIIKLYARINTLVFYIYSEGKSFQENS